MWLYRLPSHIINLAVQDFLETLNASALKWTARMRTMQRAICRAIQTKASSHGCASPGCTTSCEQDRHPAVVEGKRCYMPMSGGDGRDYLAILATSAPVVHVFSDGTNLVQPKRMPLSEGAIRACMCMKSWLRPLQ